MSITFTQASAEFKRAESLKLLQLFKAASASTGVPLALLLAIASRESNMGKTLSVSGWGDGGMAMGIMQIDKRYHTAFTSRTNPLDHEKVIQYAAGLLADNYRRLGTWQEAARAYNGSKPAAYAYAEDVMQRYRYFESLLNERTVTPALSTTVGIALFLMALWYNLK